MATSYEYVLACSLALSMIQVPSRGQGKTKLTEIISINYIPFDGLCVRSHQ